MQTFTYVLHTAKNWDKHQRHPVNTSPRSTLTGGVTRLKARPNIPRSLALWKMQNYSEHRLPCSQSITISIRSKVLLSCCFPQSYDGRNSVSFLVRFLIDFSFFVSSLLQLKINVMMNEISTERCKIQSWKQNLQNSEGYLVIKIKLSRYVIHFFSICI